MRRTVEDIVFQTRNEILADIKAGHVPHDVPDFETLQSHVDANMYGGLADELDKYEDKDEFFAFANEVQAKVDKWLRIGGVGYNLRMDLPKFVLSKQTKLPAGVYVVTDPCYVFEGEGRKALYEYLAGRMDLPTGFVVDGSPCLGFKTGGDGSFNVFVDRKHVGDAGVDSGTLCVLPLALLEGRMAPPRSSVVVDLSNGEKLQVSDLDL